MMLRDARNANNAISGALFGALAVSMIIINALAQTGFFIARQIWQARTKKGTKK